LVEIEFLVDLATLMDFLSQDSHPFDRGRSTWKVKKPAIMQFFRWKGTDLCRIPANMQAFALVSLESG